MKGSPAYYHPVNPTPHVPAYLDPMDIAMAYALDPPRAAALKYILRAGRKPSSTKEADIIKAIKVLGRLVE
jgi:hypothetical protein